MKKWSEVLTSPEYQALDEQSRSEAKNQYFNEIVTPKAIKTYGNEELPAIRNSFFNTNYNELDPIDITPEQPTEPFQFSGGTSRGAGAVGEWEEAPFSMFKETMRQLPSAIGQTMLQAPVKTLTEGIKIQNEAIEAGKMGAIKGTYDTISGLVKFGWDYLKKQGEFIPQNITQEEYDTSALFAVDRFVSGLSQKAKQKFLQSDYIKRKEQIMKAHPIATKVGEFGSDIGLLVATTALVPGFADEAAVLTKIATKYPKIALAIKGFVRSGTKGGAYGFIKELSETQDVKKALKVGGKTGLYWGSVFGAHGALENPYVRNILQTMSAHTISKIALLRAKHERGEEMSLKDWATPEMQTILIATLGVITTPAHQRAIKAQRTAIMKAAKQELYREPKSYKEAVETLKKAERVILPGGKEIPTRKAPELAVWNKPTKSFIKPEGKIVSRGSKMIDAKGKEVYKWDKFWKEFRPIRTEAGKAPKVIEVRVEKKLPVKVGEKEQILKIAAKEKVTLAKAREILKKQAEITPTKPITPPTPIKSITEPVRAVKGAVKPTKAPVKAIITDPAEVQKIKNSITDGELTLRAGTFNGKKLSAEKLDAVRRSVENAKAKIGIKDKLPPHLQKIIDKKGYTIEDVTPEGYAPAEPTPPKPISKELEPLAKEAVKYKAEGKSAEEFVEKQPKVYHGTSEKFDIFDVAKAHDTEGKQLGLGWGRGVISFTRSKGEASKYIDTVKRGKAYEGKHPQVKEAYISLKKPFKMDMHGNSIESANYERWRRARDGWKDTETDIYWGDISSGKNRRAEAFVKQLKKEGYDGIISIDTRVDFEGRATKGGADEIGVFYNKNIKTKAQLTDIYNKATAKPISKELEPLANELETKFIHSKWYKTKVENKWVSYKTKAKALDEMAKSGDFLIDEKINYKKTELANEGKGIFDYEPVYDDVLKYSGKEGGTYKLSPVEKKYFMERKKFWDNFKKQEAIKKAKDPLEQAKKYKIDKASLEYNLKHSKRELQYATRDNDNERIEFWNKKIGEDEKKLNNFLSRKKATAKVEKPAEVVKPIEPKAISEEVAKKRIKPRITEITGVKKTEIPVATTEMALLKVRLKSEARGAKAGERIGRIETKKKIYTQLKAKAVEVKKLQKSIIDYADENLTKLDRDKVAIIASKAVTKHRLARAVTMIDKMEEKYQRHVAVDSLKDTINEIDFKRLRPEYKAPITAISESIDLVNRKKKTVKGLVNMYKYIQREPDNNIPEKQLNRLATLTRTPIKGMTTDDITLIDIALKSLVKQHELKGKLIIKGKIRDFVESRDNAVGNVKKKELADTDPREGLKVSRAKQLFTTDAMNTEHICKQIDKEERGVIKEVLYDNIDDGVSEVLRYGHEANDYFWKDVGDILESKDYLRWDEAFWTKNKWAKNIDYQKHKLDSGKILKITKEERICIELDSRNKDNLRRMLEGGYRLRNNPSILYKITTDDLTKIKNSLTPKEKRVADARYKYYNTIQKDKLNKKSVELNGWEVATENDYFPMANRIYGVDIHKDYLLRNEALPSNMRQFMQSTLEGMGALKERIPNSTPLILESAATITSKSIKQTSTYYGLAEPLRSAKTLLFDPAFKTAITTRYGSHYWQSLANYLRDMEGEYQRTDNVDKMILDWINKLDVAVLGMNPFVMAKQPISLMAAAVEMDSKYIAKALKPESKEIISKYSPQLRDRLAGNVTRELGEIAQTGQVRQFWTRKHSLSQGLMSGIKRFDYEAIGRIWKAVTYETSDLYPNLTGEAKMKHIAQRTEEVVRLTQPTFHIKDRSAIGRSKSVWVRLATKYTSQRNKNYMMIMRTIDRYNNSDKGVKAKRNFMKGIAIVSILMPLMLYGIDELRNWLYKRKPTERKIRYRILKYLEYNLGNVYFVGNAFRMFTSGVERGEWFGYGISDIVTSTGEQGVKAMINTYNAIDQILSQEKYKSGDKKGELRWKASALRATNQALSFGTRIRGIPYDTIRKLIMIPFAKPENKTKALKTKLSKLRQLNRDNPSKKYREQIRETAKQLREAASKEREAQRKKRK